MSSVSVIICTYNRAQSLQETLASLAVQQHVSRTLELVVVDNNSTDQTLEVVRSFRKSSPLPLHYVREPRQGIAFARNCGIQSAVGEYLLFTDDDVVAQPTWVEAMAQCLDQTQADVVGGKIQPLWRTPRPAWLVDELLGPVIHLDWGSARMRITDAQRHFLTANMGLRRESIKRYGAFQTSLGRRGDRWVGGEDAELCQRWARRGASLVYEPHAVVSHKIEADRVAPTFFRRWFQEIGYTQAHQLPWKWHHRVSILPAWRWLECLRTWIDYQQARRGADEAIALKAECWWLLQRSFAVERWDHWTQRWVGERAMNPCHFTRA